MGKGEAYIWPYKSETVVMYASFFFAEDHFLFFRSEKVTGRQKQGASIHVCM